MKLSDALGGRKKIFPARNGICLALEHKQRFCQKKVSFKNAFSDFLIRFLRRKNFAQFRTVFTTDFEWQRSGDVNSVELNLGNDDILRVFDAQWWPIPIAILGLGN